MAGEPVTRRRVAVAIGVSALVAIACAVVLPLIGSTPVDLRLAIAGDPAHSLILFQLRVPRVLLAMLTGGALALSGVLFQALLRDALATPYTLGVSSGASLGAVAAIAFGLRDRLGPATLWVCALGGAALTLVVVLGVASEQRRISPFTLLMAGVTINSICLAAILFLHSTVSLGQSFAITRWLMGGIEHVGYSTLLGLSAVVLPAAMYSFVQARRWNLLAVGEEWAAARGMPVQRLILSGYVVASLLTGAVTALTGPIGFIGLIVPHALRMKLGADHRLLVPSSFLIGASFLAVCDTAARTLMAPAEIQVGVITAMLGGPFFIWLLRTR